MIVFSNDSKWAQSEHPSLAHPGRTPDRRSFQTAVDAFARGVYDAGLQAGLVHPCQLSATCPQDYAARHPVLVAAAFTTASDAELQWLERYAAAGGHLVVGIRTGYEDEEARARLQRKPAFLTEAAGVWYDEFSNVAEPIPLTPGAGLDLPADAAATRWADGLHVEDATVLAGYDHPHFRRFAAVTTRAHGAGRVTQVGTVPNQALSRALMAWAVEHAPGAAGTTPWRPATPAQTVTSATNRHGDRVHFVHNWSWEPSAFPLPARVVDPVTGDELDEGKTLELGAWDVRVVVEA
jgi:beta-galactosidase